MTTYRNIAIALSVIAIFLNLPSKAFATTAVSVSPASSTNVNDFDGSFTASGGDSRNGIVYGDPLGNIITPTNLNLPNGTYNLVTINTSSPNGMDKLGYYDVLNIGTGAGTTDVNIGMHCRKGTDSFSDCHTWLCVTDGYNCSQTQFNLLSSGSSTNSSSSSTGGAIAGGALTFLGLLIVAGTIALK